MKKWQTLNQIKNQKSKIKNEEIVAVLLQNRGLKTKKQIEAYLHPPDPYSFSPSDVGIEKTALTKALSRIEKAIENKESIVVYTDYDADGITAGTIMWETLFNLGAKAMPYIPHRVDEGYGFSLKGIDTVIEKYHPTLIISVDHGITSAEKIAYAKSKGIDVIVTDHHVKPEKLPDCTIVHTTQLCGAGVAWFVVKELLSHQSSAVSQQTKNELLALAAIGTIADLVPLTGANRAIVRYGLVAINQTERVGLQAMIEEAGLTKGDIKMYDVSHMLAPRLNAMGRIVHALDALRLLCTRQKEKAFDLAQKLGSTNHERQLMTTETTFHAKDLVSGNGFHNKKLLFIAQEEYNQGVIGLVAGKLVEQFYRPAIVVAKGEKISKASARSISGFNIIEAIRSCSDLLVDAGGHPMAAGFTVETDKLFELQERLEALAEKELSDELLTRVLKIDAEIPLDLVTGDLWQHIQALQPFGMGNPEPVFSSTGVIVLDKRLVGREGKHLKMTIPRHPELVSGSYKMPKQVRHDNVKIDAIGFGLGELFDKLKISQPVDIAYSIDMNEWNGNKNVQLKVRDVIQQESSATVITKPVA